MLIKIKMYLRHKASTCTIIINFTVEGNKTAKTYKWTKTTYRDEDTTAIWKQSVQRNYLYSSLVNVLDRITNIN